MSSCSKNAWSARASTADLVKGNAIEIESLSEIMSSQLLHDLELKELNSILEKEDLREEGIRNPDVDTFQDVLLDDEGFPIYDEASFLQSFEQSKEALTVSDIDTCSSSSLVPLITEADTEDSDFAMALSLQEYEDDQYNRQKKLDNQTGHVKLVTRDYIESIDAEDGGSRCYRADLELMEGESDSLLLQKHGREVNKAMQQMRQKSTRKGISTTGKVSRDHFATIDGVMDSRTRLILFKMIQNGTLNKLHGVLKTGKEASVYCADRGFMLDSKCRRLYEDGVGADEEDEEEDFVLVDDFNKIIPSSTSTSSTPGVTVCSTIAGDDTKELTDVDNSNDITNSTEDESVLQMDPAERRRIKASLISLAPYDPVSVANNKSNIEPLQPRDREMDSQPVHDTVEVIKKGPASTANSTIIVKIFLTTLNQFSNRQEYFDGDFRYHRTKFAHGNKRDIINKWCEKEYRNLIRCYRSGLRCPKPLLFRQHILLMSMIGASEQPSCQLREYVYGENEMNTVKQLFVEVISALYMMYHMANLVHGDLSEYNILIQDNGETQHAYVIDFGQAVDISHPECITLLTRDVENIVRYFNHHCGTTTTGSTSGDMGSNTICIHSVEGLVSIVTTPITNDMYLNVTSLESIANSSGVGIDMDIDSEEELYYDWIAKSENNHIDTECNACTTLKDCSVDSDCNVDPSVDCMLYVKSNDTAIVARREQNIETRKKIEIYLKQLFE